MSDYYYAVIPEYWLYPGHNSNDRDIVSDGRLYNWMDKEWTITRTTADRNDNQTKSTVLVLGYYYFSSESIQGYCDGTFGCYGYNIYPTFYLNSDVTYISETGTQSDPYRIS